MSLGAVWAAPIVTNIVLPAHAQTSLVVTPPDDGGLVDPTPNNPPVANNIVRSPIIENSFTYTIPASDILANTSDPDGDTLSVTGVELNRTEATASLQSNGDILIELIPQFATNFQDGELIVLRITYTVSDPDGLSASALIIQPIAGQSNFP